MSAVLAARWALSDTWVLAGRSLRHWRRQPQLLVLSTIQPIMLVVLFTQVFSGSVRTPGLRYVDYVVPGVIVQVVAWDSAQTAVALAADVASSTIDRFRSLPMVQPAVLVGRTLADALRSLAVVLVMLAVGAIVGFRPRGGWLATLAAVAIIVVFGYALTWLFAYIGLTAGGAESALAAGVVVVFPLMFASSAIVPTSSLPAWLRPVAEHQPITLVVNAARALLQGAPAGAWSVGALLWTVGLLVGSVPLATRRYFRAG